MLQQIIRYEKQHAIQLFFVALLLYLLSRQSLKVENGQFERQYSRIYATLVFGIATVLFCVVMILAWKGIRSFLQRGK